ncbi:B3 domain-containing protein [Melia azedarach]|uniref:B3 domain-containing protein n=1 Tax=Melia azedarach TaxID=155640 RepID=A0ACC1X3D9_MELAZ|nr:B3 domain-containing protein [Melia azedarach]
MSKRKEPATKREENSKKEDTSVSGSTSSSVHSVVLNSRVENQKQPFDSSSEFKNRKETLSLFPASMVPPMKKVPVKPENQHKKEINGSTYSSLHCFPDSRTATRVFDVSLAYRAKKESNEARMPMKRRTPEAEEKREVSVDLTLSLRCRSKIKKQRTTGISLPPRAIPEVSTKLTLFDETWPTKKRKPFTKQLSEADMKERAVACKVAAMKNYRPEAEGAEKRRGVSTKLEIYLDPWIIKKKLTPSDLGHMSRLMLKTSLVERHVFPLMDAGIVKEVKSTEGLTVIVCDQDTDSLHNLVFKKWHSCMSYVLNRNWVRDFVTRRNLEEGDEIGIYWDPNYSRFNFSVMNRAPAIQPRTAIGTSRSGRK